MFLLYPNVMPLHSLHDYSVFHLQTWWQVSRGYLSQTLRMMLWSRCHWISCSLHSMSWNSSGRISSMWKWCPCSCYSCIWWFDVQRIEAGLDSKNVCQILLAPMGVLAPGSAHAWPSAQPPSTPAEIFRAHICKVFFKHLAQSLRSHFRSFGTLGQLLKKLSLSTQNLLSAGG